LSHEGKPCTSNLIRHADTPESNPQIVGIMSWQSSCGRGPFDQAWSASMTCPAPTSREMCSSAESCISCAEWRVALEANASRTTQEYKTAFERGERTSTRKAASWPGGGVSRGN
jgi:hypothetical protein